MGGVLCGEGSALDTLDDLADGPPILLGCMLFVRLRPVHLFEDSVGGGDGDDGASDDAGDHGSP